ncbi:MAG: helix-turn-helix transcriptional regulator [Desulfobacterales bacterium]|nr:helix-turn-helix transcriptional regulator [Desulfobacterales bacterium]
MDKNKTLHKVSMGTDIDMTLLSKIERGERFPTSEQLKRLTSYFDVPESDLLSDLISEKIIKTYGINKTTYDAIQIVNEKLAPYMKKSKK